MPKISWNHFYGGYPKRKEEYRKLFDPDQDPTIDAEFVVDYSCAYYAEEHSKTPIQGRVYVTTEGINFCASWSDWGKMIGGKDKISVMWKDVSNITKENTGIFVDWCPNAIRVTTESRTYFFGSFLSRNSAFMIWISLWKAVVKQRPLPDDQILQIIACEYGLLVGIGDELNFDDLEVDLDEGVEKPPKYEDEKEHIKEWMRESKGKLISDRSYDLSVSELFKLAYCKGDFYTKFQEKRGARDLEMSDWADKDGDLKGQDICFIKTGVMGKTCHVDEKWKMEETDSEKKINVEANYSGLPYTDTFTLFTHNLIAETGPESCRMIVKADVAFKKDLFSLLKSKIENRAYADIKEFYKDLSKSLGGHKNTEDDCNGCGESSSGESSSSESKEPISSDATCSDGSFNPWPYVGVVAIVTVIIIYIYRSR